MSEFTPPAEAVLDPSVERVFPYNFRIEMMRRLSFCLFIDSHRQQLGSMSHRVSPLISNFG